jgi:replicative DNA helicase
MDNVKIPPQNIEAEQWVLGGLLINSEAITKVLEILTPLDFYREAHGEIFSAMIELFERSEPADLVTVTNILRSKDKLDAVGGTSYLASLAESAITSANIAHYAKIVHDKAILRRLIDKSTEIISKIYEDPIDVDEMLDTAEHAIFEISEMKIRPSFFPLKDVVKDSIKTVEKLYEREELVTGVATGFYEIDNLTSGFQSSDLIIVAGRPSMGKTAFALNIAQHAAIEAQVPVGFFSLEMSKEHLGLRLLSSQANVDGHRLRTGRLRESDWPRLIRAAGILSEAPIYIDDTPAISVLELRAKARRLRSEKKLGMVILDYLQLMKGKASWDSREREISEISRSLKALAKELNLPVVALSQLSRRVEDRRPPKPQLADLRESGAIEQDADVIIFIYRDELYNPDMEENRNQAEIIIGKQRNGPTGTKKLVFLKEYTSFRNPVLEKDTQQAVSYGSGVSGEHQDVY